METIHAAPTGFIQTNFPPVPCLRFFRLWRQWRGRILVELQFQLGLEFQLFIQFEFQFIKFQLEQQRRCILFSAPGAGDAVAPSHAV